MICFQKIVSLFWRTTCAQIFLIGIRLWFAFKKLYLCSDEQPEWSKSPCRHVVICFQKIVSLFWRTTQRNDWSRTPLLWFAFKKLYLCSDEQLVWFFRKISGCCDLLSKNCIFLLTNNPSARLPPLQLVVICFQKIVSLFWRTTLFCLIVKRIRLWFAFKKLYLCSDEQLLWTNEDENFSCDLLSKNCIFVLTNNLHLRA